MAHNTIPPESPLHPRLKLKLVQALDNTEYIYEVAKQLVGAFHELDRGTVQLVGQEQPTTHKAEIDASLQAAEEAQNNVKALYALLELHKSILLEAKEQPVLRPQDQVH
jgi:hypothetical protein